MNYNNLKEKGYESFEIKLNSIDDIKDFVHNANLYKTDLYLTHNEYCVDAKSILGILSLNLNDEGLKLWYDKDFNLTANYDFEKWKV